MKNQLKVRSVGEGFILYDGMHSMFVSLPFVKENMPGKIVVRERYYKNGDDKKLIIKTSRDGDPVLVNGRMIVRVCSYDPTGKVRNYKISSKRKLAELNLNK